MGTLLNILFGIKDKTAETVSTFAENKRTSIIEKVESSSATVLIIKWLFTNKLVVGLVLIISIMAARYSYLEYQYLAEKNKNLIIERDQYIEKTKELKSKVDALDKQINDSVKESNKKREEITKLSSDEKKKLILDLIRRLLLLRSRGV